MTMDYVKYHCAAFDKGKKCPYKTLELKGLGQKCPKFKEGCPFKSVKDVGEFKAKLGEMRDQCKGKANYKKALDVSMHLKSYMIPFYNLLSSWPPLYSIFKQKKRHRKPRRTKRRNAQGS